MAVAKNMTFNLQSSDQDEAGALFSNMPFPLNVYAMALLLEEGKVDYLHYGLFEQPNSSLQDAQLYSTQLIWDQLPPPPCRILEVGIGLGTTLKSLTEKGYQVHGITPDAQQIAYVQSRWDDDAPVSQSGLETFQDEPDSYDVLLFQESSQYIAPLAIFNKAMDLLNPEGRLIIIDEFALKREKAGFEGLHLLNDFLELAKRFNLKKLVQCDLSAMAAPTLAYLLKVTDKHQQALLSRLSINPRQLAELDESNKQYQQKYNQGSFGYALLHFQKQSLPKWRLTDITHAHIADVQQLFKVCFDKTLSPELWHWKYQKPASAIGAWKNQQLIAHYGGFPRSILYFGEVQQAVQIGDVMAHPDERGSLTRNSAFFRVAATFIEQNIGYGRPNLLGFGFPNDRAMKVAEHLGLYQEVARLITLKWPPGNPRPDYMSQLLVLDQHSLDQYAEPINKLWAAMAHDLTDVIIGERNKDYLFRRYLHHPEQRYHIILMKQRFTGTAQGVMVLQFSDGCCHIIDLIAPMKNIATLIQQARRIAGRHQCGALLCQITRSFTAHFNLSECTIDSVSIPVAHNVRTNGPSAKVVENKWWLMSGDMDFR